MSRHAFTRNIEELRAGIDVCITHRLQLPALVTLFAAIDIVAWLSDEGTTNKAGPRFKAWVNQYLLKAKPMKCAAEDIWAARCGVLHTLTPESDLSALGKAKQLGYAWGNKNPDEKNSQAVEGGVEDRYAFLHIGELFEGWQFGVKLLEQEMDRNPSRLAGVSAKAAKFFVADAGEVYRLLGMA